MANRKISYTTRDYQGIRTELLNYVRTYYPELIQDFNDARPSVSLVDFSITVPAFGDAEDQRYLGTLARGSQVSGAGIVFENIYDVDFTSPYNAQGFPNRLKIPNFNANNVLVNYTITKRELVVNGITKVFKRVITPNDVKPFFELFLPEKNVLGITSVLLKSGTDYTNIPTTAEFLGVANKWYEVDALAEDRVFIEDPTKVSDQPGIKVGRYIQTQNRFISEYTPEGFKKLTFGGGTNTAQDALNQFTTLGATIDLQRYSNNLSLGSALTPNSTLFVQYRVGGGLGTNLGTNVITQIGTVSFFVNGPSELTNSSVVNSLRCNNVTAAIGGAGLPSLEEIRNYVSFNFSAQKRAVTVQDYESIIRNMPSEFGAPAKVSVTENDNKILIQLLSYDTSGKLTNIVSNTLKQNVATYLSNYRMMNDYISIFTAEVIDLSIEVSIVLTSAQNSGQVIADVVDRISTYFNPQVRELGQNVYLSEIQSIVQNQNGVLTVAGIKVFNNVGGQYSSAETSMQYSDPETRQIAPVADTIFAQPSQVYQIRYPSKDIKVSVVNFQSTTFS